MYMAKISICFFIAYTKSTRYSSDLTIEAFKVKQTIVRTVCKDFVEFSRLRIIIFGLKTCFKVPNSAAGVVFIKNCASQSRL